MAVIATGLSYCNFHGQITYNYIFDISLLPGWLTGAVLSHFSHVCLFATCRDRLFCPWGFSRQEYWSGLPCPLPGDLSNPGIEPRSPILQADSLPSEPPGKSLVQRCKCILCHWCNGVNTAHTKIIMVSLLRRIFHSVLGNTHWIEL